MDDPDAIIKGTDNAGFAITLSVDPSKVRLLSTFPFGAVPSRVIIPLFVVPVNNSKPEVPDDPLEPDVPELPLVPEEPFPPAAPSKFVVQLENVPEPSILTISRTRRPVECEYDKTSPWK